MDNPRKLAHLSLIKADSVSSFSNIEVNTTISRSTLSPLDASLYTALYMGVIEKLLFLDYVIEQYSSKSLEKIDTETKNATRLGLYQLIFMDKIPDYSAINESVELAPKRSKGFVNAILRSFLRNDKKIKYPSDKWQRISIEESIPCDMLKIFISSYGEDTAEKIAKTADTQRGISLRVNTLKSTEDEIKKELDALNISYEVSPYASDIIYANGAISEIKSLIDSGCVFVQDASSRIATKILDAKRGEKILDACACPGGKSFSIAIDMQNSGSLLSCDLHKSKLSLIEKGAKRLGIDIIEVREQNGKEYVEELDSYFDRVLCDVPCSGLGVISKKPEIKYKEVSSINELPRVQYDILKNCSKYVKMGGVLVYSTCTINKKENEEVLERFLSENSGFEPCEFSFENIFSKNGAYTFLTHINQTDGFFVAKMKRTS